VTNSRFHVVHVTKRILFKAINVGVKLGFALMDEHRFGVFENTVLKRIPVHKRDEETDYWRQLHNAHLQDLYSSPDIIAVLSIITRIS